MPTHPSGRGEAGDGRRHAGRPLMLRRFFAGIRAGQGTKLDLTKEEDVTARADAADHNNGFLGLDFALLSARLRVGYVDPASGKPSSVVPFFAGGILSALFL